MFTFLLVVQALIAAVLVGVILMQQSEGGGLGMGGSPSGLMSARGAANFLTRATGFLAIAFVVLSILLAVVATQRGASSTIDTSLARQPVSVPAQPTVPLSGSPVSSDETPAPVTTPSSAPVVPLATPNAQPQQRDATRSGADAPARSTRPVERPATPVVIPTRNLPQPGVSNRPTTAPGPGAEDAN